VLVGTMSSRLSEDNHDSWVMCIASAECKTVITAMLIGHEWHGPSHN
jgi:hypothetical protein